jgi:hypothetical protein
LASQIYQHSDDYLTVSSLVATVPHYETPAVAKIGGAYFLFGSHLSGWATNDNQYSTAPSMAGPWSACKSFAPAGTNTCKSQPIFILPVLGSCSTTYVFLTDCWALAVPSMGSRILKVVPLPTSLSKLSEPPCLSRTIARAIANP